MAMLPHVKEKTAEVVARLRELLKLRDGYIEELTKEITEFVLTTRDIIRILWRVEDELELSKLRLEIPVILTHIHVDGYGNVRISQERLIMRGMKFEYGWGQRYFVIEHEPVDTSVKTCCWQEKSLTKIPFHDGLVYDEKEKVAEYIKKSLSGDLVPSCNIIGYIILVDFIVTNINAIEAMIRSIITRRAEAMQRVISSATAMLSERISEAKSRVQALAEEVGEG